MPTWTKKPAVRALMWAVIVSGIGFGSTFLAFGYLMAGHYPNALVDGIVDCFAYFGLTLIYLPREILDLIAGRDYLDHGEFVIPILFAVMFYFVVFYAAVLLWRARKKSRARKALQTESR